jgi:hypothetical protein
VLLCPSEIPGLFKSLDLEANILDDASAKQEMRDYLLGTLDAERRTALENKILCEPSAYEYLLVVEEELIDQYTKGGLSTPERHAFETHFLATAERQKNLRFGALLVKYMNSHPLLAPDRPAARHSENRAPAPEPLLAPFGWRRALRFSAVIAACLGIIVLGWVVATKIF